MKNKSTFKNSPFMVSLSNHEKVRPSTGSGRTRDFKILLLLTFVFLTFSCAHPMIEAKDKQVSKVSRSFATDANEAYNAIRWALKTTGYNIKNEDLQNGIITSSWLPSKVDTFYVAPFDHPDYGANGAYYNLEIQIVPEEGTNTRIDVIAHVKSVVSHLKSSEIEEKKILSRVADYLRSDVRVTNLGAE